MEGSFPVTVDQVADLAGLRRGRPVPGKGFCVECPFCGGGSAKRAKMLINTRLNAFKCPRCGEHGNALDLYARTVRHTQFVRGVNGRELFEEACRDLRLETSVSRRRDPEPAAPERAPDSRTDPVYRALLELPEFRLRDFHYWNLRKRGLSDRAIRENGYRSFDFRAMKNAAADGDAWRETAERLVRAGLDPEGVPGFYRKNGVWRFVLRSGLAIPVRNARREIVGLQIRTDSGDIRYITVSSAKYGGPDRDITRTHFPLANDPVPPDGRRMPEAVLTEGPLKADAAIDLLHRRGAYGSYLFLAIPGVSTVRELPEIFRSLREAGVTTVMNALDMDRFVNPHVAEACRTIQALAEDAGLRVRFWLWAEEDIDAMWKACRSLLDADALSGLSAELRSALGDGTGSAAEKAGRLMRFTSLLPRESLRSLPEWPKRSKGIDDYLAQALLPASR